MEARFLEYNGGMRDGSLPGLGVLRLHGHGGREVERVVQQMPLRRVMDFLRCSIDDVINDPMVRWQVAGYYRLQKEVDRWCEVVDLERWWNGRGILGG